MGSQLFVRRLTLAARTQYHLASDKAGLIWIAKNCLNVTNKFTWFLSCYSTAGIRVGTLLELGERDNVKRAGPPGFKLAGFKVKIITSSYRSGGAPTPEWPVQTPQYDIPVCNFFVKWELWTISFLSSFYCVTVFRDTRHVERWCSTKEKLRLISVAVIYFKYVYLLLYFKLRQSYM